MPGRSRIRETRVLLPLPEGPETTTRRPGRLVQCERGPIATPRGLAGSLNVLDQFPDLLQLPLDLDDAPADLDVVGLRADGIGLAAHLLDDELQLAAGAVGAADHLGVLLEVGAEAGDLLGDVGALGEDGDLADDVLGLE